MNHADVMRLVALAEPGQLVQVGRVPQANGPAVVLTLQREGDDRVRWDAWAGDAGSTWLGPIERQPADVREALLLQAQEVIARVADFGQPTPTGARPDTGVAVPRWARIASRLLPGSDGTPAVTRSSAAPSWKEQAWVGAHQAADVVWHAGAWVGAILSAGRKSLAEQVRLRATQLDQKIGRPVGRIQDTLTVARATREGIGPEEALRPKSSLERAFLKTADAMVADQVHYRLSRQDATRLGLETSAAGLQQDKDGQWHLLWVPGVPAGRWAEALTQGGPAIGGPSLQRRPLSQGDLIRLGDGFARLVGTLVPGPRLPDSPVVALSRAKLPKQAQRAR